MTRLARDVQRRKLELILGRSFDEQVISKIAALVAVQSGHVGALPALRDLPREALGAALGSPYHVPLWSVETLVNELLATPKLPGFGISWMSAQDVAPFATLRALNGILVRLEDAEDGIFLEQHDVFYEMARIAQRQFHWQRGVANAPNLYRSMLLYGTGAAGDFLKSAVGITVADFVKTGVCMSASLAQADVLHRQRDLSEVGISHETREAALIRLAIPHAEARVRAARMRAGHEHTAYRPSILRDFPILAFGYGGQRLRAPIPELIMLRYTSGLYLDVVQGGAAVWTGIGRRFETYVLEYLQAMMAPYDVAGEQSYGPKKRQSRTPDVLISRRGEVVAVVECKAKRMTFDARYADDPVSAAAVGYEELAKGIFQIWRFLSHARRGEIGPLRVASDCQAMVVTADSWLMMARRQAESVMAAAHAMANEAGSIDAQDRREIAFCPIEDVEFALQQGTGESLLNAAREVASGEKKGFMLSVAHAACLEEPRDYPFSPRIPELLPWFGDLGGASTS